MAYEVHLNRFEGPLDLLLHLIEQAKVDIKDIFISEITAQYLALMDEVEELDMDTASEFLTMAATLVYIKSRSLLPRPPREEAQDEEDPEEALVRQLREYKAFKEAGAKLEILQQEQARSYTRLPEEFILPPQEYSLEEATAAELYEAFFAVLNRVEPEPKDP
ncbi:MAG: segregation/condensation protein A, partial [Clostridia bacterium]|nr:segregation/condensation protein A [Clostridia bacterium]